MMKRITIFTFLFVISHFSFLISHLGTTASAQSWTADNGNGTFTNPLFYDEFSDPDILRVGDDYYLAGTTMHTVPGLVILHSKDLVNWENISYCFDRFDFDDDAFSRACGLLPSAMPTDSSMCLRISTARACSAILLRIFVDRGSTITCRDVSTT